MREIVIAGGCFWCVEAIMNRVDGVESAISGYMGGESENPTYKEVCSGTSGHAEVVKVRFDPEVIGLEDLLEIFFHTHDPTTLNRQGNDVGTQYRSAVFVADEEERAVVRGVIRRVEEQKVWDGPIVTSIEDLDTFYPAEEYHQNYFDQNGSQPYCMAVIDPKVRKFMKNYAEKAKKASA